MGADGPPGAPRLDRNMSALGGFAVALTNLSPSLSVFVGATVILQQSGTFAITAIVVAALLSAVVAGLYAELGSAFPSAGADYVLVGNTLGPAFRFAMLGFVIVSQGAGMAAAGLGIADFLRPLLTDIDARAVAVASVSLATGLAALSVRTNASITGILTALEVVALAALALFGALHPHRALLPAVLHPVMAGASGGLQSTTLAAMAAVGGAAVYTLNGSGAAVSLGEEVVGASRTMPLMVFGALAVGALCIVAAVAGAIVGVPDLPHMLASDSPLQDFVLQAVGPDAAIAAGVFVAVAIFNAMLVFALTGGRAVYCAARESAFHPTANRALTRVHPTFGSPWAATLAIGAISLPPCFAPIAALVTINGSGLAIGYGLLGAALIAGRRTGVTARTLWRMPLHPWGAWVVIVAAVALVGGALSDPESGRVGVLFTLGVMAACALAYWLVVRRTGRWTPIEAAEEGAPDRRA